MIAGQIASIAGALMLVRVLTEYLEPEQYGQLALGLTVAGLVNQVVMGGLTSGIGRFYVIADERNDLHGYLHDSRRLMWYATVVVVVIAVMLMLGLFFFGYGQWMGLAAAALIFSILNGYNTALNGIQNAARQRPIVAFHGGLDAWLKILLAMALMYWLGKASTTVVVGYSISSLIVTGSQLLFLRARIRTHAESSGQSANWIRQIWEYSWPFSTWGVFSWAQQVSDRWALQSFASTQDVGLYAVVFQLGYAPIGLAAGIAIAFLGPILYQKSGGATDCARNTIVHHTAWRIALLWLLMTSIASFLTFMFHEWIFRLLVAREYYAASCLLPWAVLAGGIFAAGQMLALKLMSEMKSTVMITAKIVTAILGVILNFIGAMLFGMQGVVAALVVFSAIYFLWMTWISKHPPVLMGQNN